MGRIWAIGLILLALAAPVGRSDSGAPGAVLVPVPAGAFVPIFGDRTPAPVAPFLLDERPVTNGEFLEFVRAHPEWQRSRVSRQLADASYLLHWAGDLELGERAPSDAPVTSVSWFAARAYARARGCRLPTTAEWERAADPGEDEARVQRILRWYGQPVRLPLPAVRTTEANDLGLWDLHGLVWEWVSDFNNALVTGESRADAALERDLFCGSGAVGASDFRDYAAFMRYAFRSSLKANYTVQNLGFRCARDGATP